MRPARAVKRVDALLAFMEHERWYDPEVLVAVGGARFQARLHEIAKEHRTLTYDCRCINDDTGHYQYRLRLRRPDEERPVKRVSKLRALEAEVARLERELSELRRVWVPLSPQADLLLEARVATVGL